MESAAISHAYSESGVAMGCLGNVLFMYWREPRQLEAIRNVFERMDTLMKERSGPLGILVQLGYDGQLPEGQERLAIALGLKERSSRIAGVTVVSSRAGLKLTSIRMTLASIEVLTERAPELRLCTSVEEGSSVLSAMFGERAVLSIPEMIAAMSVVRGLESSDVFR